MMQPDNFSNHKWVKRKKDRKCKNDELRNMVTYDELDILRSQKKKKSCLIFNFITYKKVDPNPFSHIVGVLKVKTTKQFGKGYNHIISRLFPAEAKPRYSLPSLRHLFRNSAELLPEKRTRMISIMVWVLSGCPMIIHTTRRESQVRP